MILSTSAALFLFFISAAWANFDLYSTQPPDGSEFTWQIFDSDPDCNTVFSTRGYRDSQDVSGDKTGVRCGADTPDGCYFVYDPITINVVEMHFSNNPLYHWTIYKDRNFDMIGLDGKTYGHCILFPANNYKCEQGISSELDGYRKFRCITQFSAAQINGASI